MEYGTINKTKKQIILRLSGGLGNQLWQLAAAYQVMQKYGMEEILLDTRSYKTDIYREFELENYILPDWIKLLRIEKQQLLIYDLICFFYSKFRGLVFRIKNQYLDNRIGMFYKKGYFITHNNIVNISEINVSTIFMSGYFQNIKNIELVLDEFLDLLKPKKERLGEIFQKFKASLDNEKIYTAVSVRCGKDYQKLKWNICGKEYFCKALTELECNKVLVFSDDISEAKKMLKDIEAIYVPQLSPIEQIELMKFCEKFVVSNSTFSYWGMLISPKKEKQVIYPKKWFPYLETKDAEIVFGNYKII